jgi:hypothetical protein
MYSDGLWAGRPRFNSREGVRDFSLHSVQADPGTHPASYPTGTGALSPAVKRPGREAPHSSPANAVRLHGVVLN